jgi:hypothetical protein
MMHIVAPPGSSRDLNTAYSMPQNRDPQRSIQIECPSQNSARPRCSILACSGPSGGFTECLKTRPRLHRSGCRRMHAADTQTAGC